MPVLLYVWPAQRPGLSLFDSVCQGPGNLALPEQFLRDVSEALTHGSIVGKI
jgi:hypothetical protein